MVLAGKTEAVSTSEIIEDLTEANADVETMAGLIEELEAALEGKSVEGGGAAVETCTVEISHAGTAYMLMYTSYENNQLVPHVVDLDPIHNNVPDLTIQTTVGNILFVNAADDDAWNEAVYTNCVVLSYVESKSNYEHFYAIQVYGNASIVC